MLYARGAGPTHAVDGQACVTGVVSGVDDVLSRFHDDPDFRDALTSRPAEALAPYRLSRNELDALSARLAEACDCVSVADRRCTLAGLLRLLAVTAASAPDPTEP